jgi:hypothetical protein
MQTFLHYFLHLGFPFFIAFFFFKKDWKKVYLILLGTMLVDLDHLLAEPIFQPDRCSINFHPLHTYWAMVLYAMMLFLKRPYWIIGLGLLLHMATDLTDCLITYDRCRVCLSDAPAFRLVDFIMKIIQ